MEVETGNDPKVRFGHSGWEKCDVIVPMSGSSDQMGTIVSPSRSLPLNFGRLAARSLISTFPAFTRTTEPTFRFRKSRSSSSASITARPSKYRRRSSSVCCGNWTTDSGKQQCSPVRQPLGAAL